MDRIVYLVCRIAAPELCEERRLDYVPQAPIACVYAAGPELERAVAPGWGVARWSCTFGPDETTVAAGD